MQKLVGLLCVIFARECLSYDVFAGSSFNADISLFQHGIDISKVPGLASVIFNSSTSGCLIACDALQFLYTDQVLQRNASSYVNFTNGYWSAQQAAVRPHCIFKPSSSSQVAVQVLISRLTQCPFAIKSGGHAAFAGASSIQGGITLSLEGLNSIEASAQSVIIGPGNRWHDVYQALEPNDIAVVGGRVSAIGVGGLTLGGGLSFFANIYGWACDNVLSYELVTASGTILNVSETRNAELYWALRGGGNNFGVVTKFEFRTFPLVGGRLWGGQRVFASINTTTGTPTDTFERLTDAFLNLGDTNAAAHPQAAQILSFASAQGLELAAAVWTYTEPIADPPAFAEFLAIPGSLSDTTSVRTLISMTDELAISNPDGRRETYWVASFKLTKEMVAAIKDIFFEELPSVIDAAGIVPASTLQVVTVSQLEAMQQRGGNALGLDPTDGPLLIAQVNVQWDDIADDARIMDFSRRVNDRAIQFSEEHGLASPYIYMNYASQMQDVISGYGESNKARLQEIAQKYDPHRVFQDLVPGGFKLSS